MGQLSADKPRQLDVSIAPQFDDVPASNVAIYRGSAVGNTSGYGRQLVAGDDFLGFAEEPCDNSAGSAGDKKVRVRTKGKIVLAVTGVSAVTDIGATVYASDGNTFTKASTGNTAIGKITRWITSTTCEVYFESLPYRSL